MDLFVADRVQSAADQPDNLVTSHCNHCSKLHNFYPQTDSWYDKNIGAYNFVAHEQKSLTSN